MKFTPISLKDANAFVEKFHRHNKPVIRAKYQLGLLKDTELIGVGIVGRPVARALDNGKTLEVLRVCIKEGNPNACSKMYARLRRIAFLLGFEKVITYTLKSESQSSLKALKAVVEAETKPHSWNCKSRPRQHQKIYDEPKLRWNLGVETDLSISPLPSPSAQSR